jgi:O-antigen/teichoic acid export membrane protein
LRRHAFARLNLRVALACDSATAALQLALLGALAWSGRMSGWTAQAAIGVACGLAAAGFLWRDRGRFEVSRRHVALGMQRNWRIGRWSLAGLSLAALGGHFVNPWLLAILLDERATGLFGACVAVLAFSNPLLLAASNLLSPRMARTYAAGGTPAVNRLVRRSTAVLCASMTLFCGAVALWGGRLMEVLFGRSQPIQQQVLLVLALSTFVAALIIPADIGLWAVERADINFRSRLAGVVFTALGSLALIGRLGLVGAAYGQLLGNLAAAAVTGFAYHSILHDRPRGGLPESKP